MSAELHAVCDSPQEIRTSTVCTICAVDVKRQGGTSGTVHTGATCDSCRIKTIIGPCYKYTCMQGSYLCYDCLVELKEINHDLYLDYEEVIAPGSKAGKSLYTKHVGLEVVCSDGWCVERQR